MVVHLGVIVMAVGIIAATTYRHQTELALARGQVVTYSGHRFEFVGLRNVRTPSKQSDEALVKVDGAIFTPATTNFGGALATVGTPAIDSGAFGDVYLTFDQVGGLGNTSGNSPVPNLPAGSVAIGVVIEPLLAWLWAGGLLVGLGGMLALVPGSRRRATDPVSAPSDMVIGSTPDLEHANGSDGSNGSNGSKESVPVENQAPAKTIVPVEEPVGADDRCRSTAVSPPHDDERQASPHDPLGGGRRPALSRRRRGRPGHAYAAGGDAGGEPVGRSHGPALLGRRHSAI